MKSECDGLMMSGITRDRGVIEFCLLGPVSTLPEVQLTIRSTSSCGTWTLFNAPVTRSSSVPNDIDPANLAGTGSSGYRVFVTRAGEQLFY